MAFSALHAAASRYGVTLTDTQLTQFGSYSRMLLEWSQRANLVGNAAPDIVERRHFIESIALGSVLRERELLRPDSRVIDVGAGAGFPGVVVKIVWPGVHLTLLEATAKKTAFLDALVSELALPDTRIVTARAEDAGRDPVLREAFDLVLARAVAPLPALLELALPFARVGGRLAAVKGSRADSELSAAAHALEVLGAKALAIPLPVEGPAQQVIVAFKRRATPEAYPRRPGMPTKQPL